MTPSEVQKKRQQQLAELLRVTAPEPMTPREEAIQILADGLLELIIQRGRQLEYRTNRSNHWLRVQARREGCHSRPDRAGHLTKRSDHFFSLHQNQRSLHFARSRPRPDRGVNRRVRQPSRAPLWGPSAKRKPGIRALVAN